jgi:hypothetical protein
MNAITLENRKRRQEDLNTFQVQYAIAIADLKNANLQSLKELAGSINISEHDRVQIKAELVKRGFNDYAPKITVFGHSVRTSFTSGSTQNTCPSGTNFTGWVLKKPISGMILKAGNHVMGFASAEIAQAYNVEKLNGEYIVDWADLEW